MTAKQQPDSQNKFRWVMAGGVEIWTDLAPDQEEIMANLVFVKSGKEIKAAIQTRRAQLQQRLEKRNRALDKFMKDPAKVRSYLVRSSSPEFGGHGGRPYSLYGKNDISSEERQEIEQLCRRIHDIEQELYRLELTSRHLRDQDSFSLSIEDLVGYGFDTSIESGR